MYVHSMYCIAIQRDQNTIPKKTPLTDSRLASEPARAWLLVSGTLASVKYHLRLYISIVLLR